MLRKIPVLKLVRTYYVREIITILSDPRLCPTCGKSDKLEENVIAENISCGKTFLCTRCEALTVVTNLNLKRVDLASRNNDILLLKEPHLIRKVTY